MYVSVSYIYTFADAYGIFIDNGNLDSYLGSEVNTYNINDTFFNGSFNASSTAISNVTNADAEDVAELIIMAVTSTLLGLMILITVIGKVFHHLTNFRVYTHGSFDSVNLL